MSPLKKAESVLKWTDGLGRPQKLVFDRPLIMAIVNITPDSFSDGGKYFIPEAALAQAEKHIREGADILDLGAETTRPGSRPTPADEEWRRLEPVLKGLAQRPNCPPISVDTNKAVIAEKALKLGASIVNDIWAGRLDPDILKVAAKYDVPLILMHMLGDPRTMQENPHYDDVVLEVREFLQTQANAAIKAGVDPAKIILDPGLGFGKLARHNLTLLKRLEKVFPPGFHTLMALSRKAFLGHILSGAPPDQRDLATAAASCLAIAKGAEIIRVHAVKPSLEAALVAHAIMSAD
ncbi:MAG: dihydropteroate synthase [Deltaproteobacteria bacterium]|jgi:dihydropteroate synthase|nr:dihydropteroate synthase [Deltaproteobacteria bacterium]